jgi:hypothetical protein
MNNTDEIGFALVRHHTKLCAENEPALSARLRLLAEALRLRGGRVVDVRHHRRPRKAKVSASVAYELPSFASAD